ncbi:MAG: glutamate--tRNA ligase family protein [Bacteroidota bacterium]
MSSRHFRIAPTPSGFLHQGNVANFILAAALAEVYAGKMLVRIDDLDITRTKDAYLEQIFSVIDQLAIPVHKGPRSKEDLSQYWSQQLRIGIHQKMLDRLVATGRVYACSCSRSQIRAQSAKGVYSGTCRNKNIPLTTPNVAWRLVVDQGTMVQLPELFQQNQASVNLATAMGDFVVRKKDASPAYQLASIADDIHFGITDIVRGVDLLASSAAQWYIGRVLGEADYLQSVRFYHHPLLVGADGEKLAKSAGALAMAARNEFAIDLREVKKQVCDWVSNSALNNQDSIILALG